uniref:Carboxylic ester hydrolase n=1 Tax=Panagrolaimus sp. JU765 TaxID=591449 RepID=A0AC34QDS6_9BILA
MIFTKILGFLSILLVGFVETFVLPPLAVTKYGFVLGTKRVLPSGKQVDFFQKVPFAKPPIGNLRFEKPVPPDPWGFVNSSSPIVSCVQFSGSTAGSEDCLYMTIARPEVPSLNGGYPVMVHIFGGGFITGSSSSYNSVDANDRFVTQGIILVTFNYRLGPLGFYTTGDSNALGNYGIWDQIRALEFIQETIRGFGGNPNKVTVFGNSAGGLSATWLSYSPHSKGLFQRIIPYCGTCQSGMAFSQHTLKYSKQLEETLGCGTVQDKKSCLKTKNLTEILLAGKVRVPIFF